MPRKSGIGAAVVVACLGAMLPTPAARADSILTEQPSSTQNEVIEWVPVINFARTGGTATDSIGVLSITATAANTEVLGGTTPFTPSPFNISVNIDVNIDGLGTVLSGPTIMNVQGAPSNPSDPNVIFNESTDLSAFAMNLNLKVDPLAFMFTVGTSNYYTASNQSYVIAQLVDWQPTAPDPLTPSGFFIGTGTSVSWSGGADGLKLDVWSVALPLPAPFYCGAVLLAGVAGTTTFIRKRRSA